MKNRLLAALSIAVLSVPLVASPVLADETMEEAEVSGEEEAEVSDEAGYTSEDRDVFRLSAWQDGEDVVIEYKTKHSNPWDYCYQNYPITIHYSDGSTGEIVFEWNGEHIHGKNWSSIEGYSVSKDSDQADTETAIIRIPASWFTSLDFTLSGGGYETFMEAEPPVEEKEPAIYEGISIDGHFRDWDAVEKHPLLEPDDEHKVESVAWVTEDDAVYIYIKDSGNNSATWAGPAHNGKFAITTDLGRTLVLQLNENGLITGADGIESVHNGSQWEAYIPASIIPQNNGTLNFGLFHYEPSLTGAAPGGGNTKDENGIAYDAVYGDWDPYPHQEIYYSGAGTHNNVPDGEAAIYIDDKIYGHCVTEMPEHLNEYGGEFTQGVNIVVNNNWSRALQMRLVSSDSEGNLNWNPKIQGLEEGTHEYYIFGTDAWGSSANIGNLVPADVCYGKFAVTIKDGRQDAEWYIDIDKLAARNGFEDPTSVKAVASQYQRIGNDVVTAAGTPTGAGGSALLMFLATAVPVILKKSRFAPNLV